MANDLVDGALRFVDLHQDLTLTERTAAVVGGLVIAAIGAKPRPNKVLGLLVLVAGAALAIRGATASHSGESSGGAV